MRIIQARRTDGVSPDNIDEVIVLSVDNLIPAADVIEELVGPSRYWAVQSETLMALADPEAELPSDLPTNVPLVRDPGLMSDPK